MGESMDNDVPNQGNVGFKGSECHDKRRLPLH